MTQRRDRIEPVPDPAEQRRYVQDWVRAELVKLAKLRHPATPKDP